MRWPLGVAFIVYGDRPIEEAASLAADHGFVHIDAMEDTPDGLAVPVGDRFAMKPTPGCTSGPAREGTRSWDLTLEDFRRAPGARIEPWPGSVVGSNDAVLAFLEAVPDVKLTLDVGHVVAWGGDPLPLLPHAAHVQLRQAVPGRTQSRDGDVDFRAILTRLDALDYTGLLSVEWFQLPERGTGWSVEDPVEAALETAREVRALL